MSRIETKSDIVLLGVSVSDALEHAIARFSQRQHGYITRAQLLSLGAGSIKVRVRSGRLIPVYTGVYAVGRLPSTPIDRAAGAILACGAEAVLSHRSAATLWGWLRPWQVPFHVTAPSGHAREGVVVHRSTSLTRADRRTHLGLRVTSPARTILDIAPTLDARQLRRIVNDAQHSFLRLEALADVVRRFSRHPGAKLLRRYVETGSRGPSRSDWEDAFTDFCEQYGLPAPLINARVHGDEVDAWFPEHRLVVELDSWGFHKDRDSFEHDCDKDANLLVHGIETIRITWERMHAQPEREAARLLAILDRRRAA